MQPDSASDWANVVVNAVIALLTLAALVTSIVVAVRSTRDAREERAKSDALAQQAIDAERAGSKFIADERRAIEIERLARAELEDAEYRAKRQAIYIDVNTDWLVHNGLREIDSMGFGRITPFLFNRSGERITDVRLWLDHSWGKPLPPGAAPTLGQIGFADRIDGNTRTSFGDSVRNLNGFAYGQGLGYVVEFTDFYLDRWRQHSDGTLTLLTRRVVRFADGGDPLDSLEWDPLFGATD